MGAPKQKWTAEEEAALKAGILKHGAGKWRTILKDPEFSGVLYLRSNVDLKDKWRNMCVMPNGFGSREKSRVAIKRVPALSAAIKQENLTSTSDGAHSDEEMVDVQPILTPTSIPTPTLTPTPAPTLGAPPPLQISSAPKRSIVRLDSLIMEAIANLKEPGGSSKTAIASYIEDQYWAPPDFKQVLSAKLNFLTSSGKLIKVKHNYQISPSFISPEKRSLPMPRIDSEELSVLKSQIDVELAKMRSMTPQEAALAAARAVAEAEAAILEAEEAAREADEAEADAQAAQAFLEAATKMIRGRSISNMQMTRA